MEVDESRDRLDPKLDDRNQPSVGVDNGDKVPYQTACTTRDLRVCRPIG